MAQQVNTAAANYVNPGLNMFTGELKIPIHNSPEGPVIGAGAIRLNTDTLLQEYWNGSAWMSVGGTVASYEYREDKTYIVNRGMVGDPADGDSQIVDSYLDGWRYSILIEGFYLTEDYEWEYLPGGGFTMLYRTFYGSTPPPPPNDWLTGERIRLRFYPKEIIL